MTNILDTAQRPAKPATVPTTPTALITPTNSNATDDIIGIASNAAANTQADTTNHFNRREKHWILYDVGNSAFVLLSTAVIPIYANSLLKAAGESNIVSTWGYMQTIASLIIALLMPILGSIADVQGMKIKFFIGFFGTGVLACCSPWRSCSSSCSAIRLPQAKPRHNARQYHRLADSRIRLSGRLSLRSPNASMRQPDSHNYSTCSNDSFTSEISHIPTFPPSHYRICMILTTRFA